ncbi:MAG: flagellar basal body rod protein FlgC [Gammaproteobacteria bacterium]|nr:flagellar basal body rod protein FlgC [Gammaproteobacteria bacterium]MDH5594763.1 flagellar basal body rod protein FlgC [Gammaproteobacteria bacterium]MDH5614321.1 flagellar basal body rod protein FlgC [Gammaproteobacteria bacterium]
MPLSQIFDVSGTAMTAQSVRLNTIASNLANAETASSSAETAYRARQPVFSTILENEKGNSAGGVKVLGIVESPLPPKQFYNPGHPMANKDGYIFMPNVNAVEEMANMISASRSFQSNVEVMNTAKQLMTHTLRLGQ